MSNDLNNKIDIVERKITSTEVEIEETKEVLKNPRDVGHEAHLRETLRQLRDKEKQLRDEKNKLLDEKNGPINLRISLTNRETELLKDRNLKEANRQSKSFLYFCATSCWCDHSNPIAFTDITYRCLHCHSNIHKSSSQYIFQDSTWKGDPFLILGALASNLHLFGTLKFQKFFHSESILQFATSRPIAISLLNGGIQYVIFKSFNWFEQRWYGGTVGDEGGLIPAPAPQYDLTAWRWPNSSFRHPTLTQYTNNESCWLALATSIVTVHPSNALCSVSIPLFFHIDLI